MDTLRRCYIKPLTSRAEVAEVIAALRPEDRLELQQSGLYTDAEAVDSIWEWSSEQTSPLALEAVYLHDGTPMAVGGCGEVDGVGIPWILCTTHSSAYPVALWEAVRFKAPLWDAAYPRQFNRAWVPNTRHIALIRKLGYTLAPEVCPQGFVNFTKGM